jgi:protein ImuA
MEQIMNATPAGGFSKKPAAEKLPPMIAMPDRISLSPQHDVVARLRRTLIAQEQQNAGKPVLPFGIPSLDAALGGGLCTGALHEIAAARETEIPAATGFALALAARAEGPLVWVAEDMAIWESGAPYGPGLFALGLAPERLIAVAATKSRDVLWAMEEALACGAGAVLGEIRGPIDFTASRRLSLAAGKGHALALLLRSAPGEEASAAATRFILGAAASSRASGPGPPRFSLQLRRNRRGHLGAWVLEWNCVEQRFHASADREPVAQTARDRPRQAG